MCTRIVRSTLSPWLGLSAGVEGGMTVLQLSHLGSDNYDLAECGEEYERRSHFRDAAEVTHHLDDLGLLAWQIRDLWNGKEVELELLGESRQGQAPRHARSNPPRAS